MENGRKAAEDTNPENVRAPDPSGEASKGKQSVKVKADLSDEPIDYSVATKTLGKRGPRGPPKDPNHPRTAEMVNTAIARLGEPRGSSIQAIKKYIATTYNIDVKKKALFIKKYLISAVKDGILYRTKGNGATGTFRIKKEMPRIDKEAEKAAKEAERQATAIAKANAKAAAIAAKAKAAAKKEKAKIARAKRTAAKKDALKKALEMENLTEKPAAEGQEITKSKIASPAKKVINVKKKYIQA